MRIAMISFTRSGAKICRRLEAELTGLGHACNAWGKAPFSQEEGLKDLKESLYQWTKVAFAKNDAIVFVGACGIAVRAISPYLRNKTEDPAIIVVDEKGSFAISLLSGHIGGANGLTRLIAKLISATPVVTTATDLNGCFAVDEWAKQNHLKLSDMKLAKEISAAILRGEKIGVSSDFPIKIGLPDQLVLLSQENIVNVEAGLVLLSQENIANVVAGKEKAQRVTCGSEEIPDLGVRISVRKETGPFNKTLLLTPAAVTVGIGCRKGISTEAAEGFFYKVIQEQDLSLDSVERLCSIDIKMEEPAIRYLAKKLGVPLEFYSAAELAQAPGEFSSSEFVSHITGVDNVCERAAVLGSQGTLIIRKQSYNGITLAAAVRRINLRIKTDETESSERSE